MKKDLNYIAGLEKAIAKKYGELAIKNPKACWTDNKEKEFLKDLKEFYEKEYSSIEENQITEVKKLTTNPERVCPCCQLFSFSLRDDVYMNKYKCCFDCYIQYVEDREDRWFSGWRPKRLTN